MGPFYSDLHNSFYAEVGREIYPCDCEVAWSFVEYYVGQRFEVHFKILREFVGSFRFEAEVEFNLSSTDRWSDKEDHSIIR